VARLGSQQVLPAPAAAHKRGSLCGLPLDPNPTHTLRAGLDTPCGSAAVGWRVAVYWRSDAAFHSGDVAAYYPASGRHRVVYDDRADETLDLGAEVLRWVLPLGVAAGPSPAPQAGYPLVATDAGSWPGAGGARATSAVWVKDYGGEPAPGWGRPGLMPPGHAACWWQAPGPLVPSGAGVDLGPAAHMRRPAGLDRRAGPALRGAPFSAPAGAPLFGGAAELGEPGPLRYELARTVSAPAGRAPPPRGLEAELLAELGGGMLGPPAHAPAGPCALSAFASERPAFAGGRAGLHAGLAAAAGRAGGLPDDLLLLGGGPLGGPLPEEDAGADVAEFLCAGGLEEDPLVAACAPRPPACALATLGSSEVRASRASLAGEPCARRRPRPGAARRGRMAPHAACVGERAACCPLVAPAWHVFAAWLLQGLLCPGQARVVQRGGRARPCARVRVRDSSDTESWSTLLRYGHESCPQGGWCTAPQRVREHRPLCGPRRSWARRAARRAAAARNRSRRRPRSC